MLVAMRVLAGGASASVLAVGAGTIADLWPSATRGRAMGIFYLGPLTGPLVIPIIGGALSQGFGWRAAMWFQTVYSGVMLVLITFAVAAKTEGSACVWFGAIAPAYRRRHQSYLHDAVSGTIRCVARGKDCRYGEAATRRPVGSFDGPASSSHLNQCVLGLDC